MNTFTQFLSYIFWPNPGNAHYSSPKSLLLLIFCALLILVVPIAVSFWRKKVANPVTKKLSRSWSIASFWFGFTGLILVVSRVEQIQFLAMRFLWVLWIAFVVFYIVMQFRSFRMRHYEVLPKVVSVDPRSKYLPKRKR